MNILDMPMQRLISDNYCNSRFRLTRMFREICKLTTGSGWAWAITGACAKTGAGA